MTNVGGEYVGHKLKGDDMSSAGIITIGSVAGTKFGGLVSDNAGQKFSKLLADILGTIASSTSSDEFSRRVNG